MGAGTLHGECVLATELPQPAKLILKWSLGSCCLCNGFILTVPEALAAPAILSQGLGRLHGSVSGRDAHCNS
jgi:hypothetical protein